MSGGEHDGAAPAASEAEARYGWSAQGWPPGSPEAKVEGCTCAVLDNAGGRGLLSMRTAWVFTVDCPVHRMHRNAEGSPDASR